MSNCRDKNGRLALRLKKRAMCIITGPDSVPLEPINDLVNSRTSLTPAEEFHSTVSFVCCWGDKIVATTRNVEVDR